MNEDDGNAAAKEARLNNKTVANKLAIEKWYQKEAKDYEEEGAVEVDENATVSMGGDPGAYVQAWVWVYNPDCSGCGERIEELEEIPEDRTNFTCPKCKKEEAKDDGGNENRTDAAERSDAPGTSPDGGAQLPGSA